MDPRLVLGAGLADAGVIVTGAASGIGRSTAALFAETGSRVCLIDRDEDGLAATLAHLGGEDGRHFAVVLDLTDTEGIEPVIRDAVARLGKLRALVHAAAYLQRQQVSEVSPASFDIHVAVNFKATFFLNRVVADIFAAQADGGRIINFTSTAWMTGALYGADVYAATKGAVVTLSRSLAKRFGAHNVTVNVIAPGQIDTPMQHRDNTDEILQLGVSMCPLGRMGSPAEVAAVAVFLASDHASYISGATINVSGGSLLY